jgi:hypothetical protein
MHASILKIQNFKIFPKGVGGHVSFATELMPLKKSSLNVSTNLMYIHLSFQSQKVSQKGPEKKESEQMWQAWINSMGRL